MKWRPIETAPDNDTVWVARTIGYVGLGCHVQGKHGWVWTDAEDGTELKPPPQWWQPYEKPNAPSLKEGLMRQREEWRVMPGTYENGNQLKIVNDADRDDPRYIMVGGPRKEKLADLIAETLNARAR